MSDHIPPEVIEEIFLRLPVKSLIKLSIVCKLWYSLISSPSFVSLYTHFTTLHKTNNTLFIIRRFSKVQAREIFTLNYDCIEDDDCSKLLVQYRQLNFPFKSSFGCFQIVGSCYGLLCLINNNFEEAPSCSKPIILWNPLVGKFVTVPVKHSGDYSSSCESIIGFGYDSSRSDYKVVRIAHCFGDYQTRLGSIEVEIFEVSVGAWRGIKPVESSSYVITRHSPQAFLNGAIHWIGYKHPNEALDVSGKLVVAVFNVIDEVFGELEMPDEIATARFLDSRSKTTVSVFGESLCLMRYCSEEQWQHHPCYELCHVWVMKEYGVAQTWIKMYTICPWGGFSKTLGLRSNGEILLMTSYGEMVSYDPKSQMISPLEIHGESSSFYLDIYTESLFLWTENKGLSGKKSSSNRISV